MEVRKLGAREFMATDSRLPNFSCWGSSPEEASGRLREALARNRVAVNL